MANAYGQSSQGGTVTINSYGPFACTTLRLRKGFLNDDTTVTSSGWEKLCPIVRRWFVDVELPSRSSDSSDLLDFAFDSAAFPATPENVAIPSVTFQTPNGRTYVGNGMLDGEFETALDAKKAVILKFTIRGSDLLTATGG